MKFTTVHFFNNATGKTDCDNANFREGTERVNETTCHKCIRSKAFQDRVFAMTAVTRDEATYDSTHARYSFSFR